ncbi:MAG: bacterioferritin [Acidimicrobiales bacterium]|nr:MAG: bacterioferritin [Acidimicrobiales bacterium]
MKGDPAIVEMLNEILTAELAAINQYFLDAKMFENWGIEKLAAHFRDQALGEMKDAEELVERILYLDGMPNLQRIGHMRVGETPAEKLEAGLALEREAVERLRRGVELCWEKGDHGTRELLEKILVDEEQHVDWLEQQFERIERVGLEMYLAEHLHD